MATDQCKHCELRGKYNECLSLECSKHVNWVNKMHVKRIEDLETALQDARLFAVWVECLGRTDCEIYKHELKSRADLSLERIDLVLP